MSHNDTAATPMNKTAQEYAQTLLYLCNGDKDCAKIECFNAARTYHRLYPSMLNKYWVECYQAISEA